MIAIILTHFFLECKLTRSNYIRRQPFSLWPIILVKTGSRQSNSLISYLLLGLKPLRPPSFAQEVIIFSTPPNLSINLYGKTNKQTNKQKYWREEEVDKGSSVTYLNFVENSDCSSSHSSLFFLLTENHLGLFWAYQSSLLLFSSLSFVLTPR